MACPICKVSPCICGEKYVNLSDFGLVSLVHALYTILKDRKVDIACTINGTPIEDYLNQSDADAKDNVGTLSNMIKGNINFDAAVPGAQDFISKYKADLLKYLEDHKDEAAILVYNKLTEADEKIIAFPLLVLMLRITWHRARLQHVLIRMYQELLVNVDVSSNLYSHILKDADRMPISIAVHMDLAELAKITQAFKDVVPVWKAASKAWWMARLLQVVCDSAENAEKVLETSLQCFEQLVVDNDKENADYWASRFFKDIGVDFGGMVI